MTERFIFRHEGEIVDRLVVDMDVVRGNLVLEGLYNTLWDAAEGGGTIEAMIAERGEELECTVEWEELE